MLLFYEKIFIEIKTTWITWHISWKFLSVWVMSYEQFIVSIVVLIMLS